MLELRTFGSAYVQRNDGTPIGGAVAQRRSLALLAVLAVSGDAGIRRESLLALLWPDADPEKSRHALTQSLYQLRRALDCDELFSTTGANLRLNGDHIVSDVAQFVAATESGDDACALSLYRGAFLDGFVLPSCVEFDQWLSGQRERLKASVARVRQRVACAAEARGDWPAALDHLGALVLLDPLNAVATMRLMRAMAAAGDRPGAIRQGRLHATLMRTELELEPDADVEQLLKELTEARGDLPRVSGETARIDLEPVSAAVHADERLESAPGNRLRWPIGIAVAAATVIAAILLALQAPLRGARDAALPLGDQPIVVAPFRVAGSDSSLGYLREGIVELLSSRLGRDSAALAVDPGRVLGAWRKAKLTGAADTPHPAAVRIARELGASRVVVGGVVGNATRLVVSASLLGVGDGATRGTAQVEGSADSITVLVERLAAKLVATGAGEGDRFDDRFVPSLAALRDFLEGQAAYYRGNFAEAVPAYERALARDSTFALAAMHLALAADQINDAEQHDRALAIAWAHRHDLNERDLTHLVAFAGPRYPAPSHESEQIAAWERAVTASPDRPDVWYELGERLFRAGGVAGLANAHVRARRVLTRALALAPGHTRARRLLIMLSARAGDTATLTRIATPAALRDSVGELSAFLRWRVALARGDSSELRVIRASFATLNDQSLRAIAMSSLNDAVGVLDGERASRITLSRADHAAARYDALIEQHSLALNKGRPTAALALTAQLAEGQFSSHAHYRLRVLDAVYAEGDHAAATEAADSLAIGADAPLVRDPYVRSRQLADACVLEQWRLSQGSTRTASRAIARLRANEPPRRIVQLAANQLACAALLEAWLAVATRSRDATARVAALDSLALFGPGMSDASSYAHILVGRLYLALGNPRAALTAFRRRTYMTGWPRYLATVRREEALVAVSVGDTAIARANFARYLAIRRRPEPALLAAVNEVRKQARALSSRSADVER
jgi:DNA-binding SARP family transcriptional activator